MSKLVAGKAVPLSDWDIADRAQRRAQAQAAALQQLQDDIVLAAQQALDAFAAARGYDGILSACTYATSTVPKFAAEAQYCVELRDQTWAKLYEILADVQAGKRPVPSGFDDIAGELPTATAEWPAAEA